MEYKYESENIAEIASALVKAQGLMSAVQKDSVNTFFRNSRYSSINAVIEAIREPLSSNGIAYIQRNIEINGKPYIETKLIHTSGQFISSLMFLDMNGVYEMSKVWHKDSQQFVAGNVDQKLGATLTYYRRYSLLSILGLAPGEKEDDDGNSLDRSSNTQPKASPMPSKISKEQIQYFQDQLKFHGEPVASEFMGRLATKNVFKIEDMQAHWFEGAKKVLFELIEKYQGCDQDGE